LGVSALEYWHYAFFNYLTPIIIIIFAFLKINITMIKDDPSTVISTDK
jgi:NhaC family Na+:H+ antiporter